MYMIIVLLKLIIFQCLYKKQCHIDNAFAIRPSERDMGSKVKITQSECLQKGAYKVQLWDSVAGVTTPCTNTRHKTFARGCRQSPNDVSRNYAPIVQQNLLQLLSICWGMYPLSRLSIKMIPEMLYGIHVWRTLWPWQYVDVNVIEIIVNRSGCMRSRIVLLQKVTPRLNRSQHLIPESLTSQISTDDEKPCFPLNANTAPYHDVASTKRVHILDTVWRQSLSPMSINMNLAIISEHVEAIFIREQHPFPITPLPPTYSSCPL